MTFLMASSMADNALEIYTYHFISYINFITVDYSQKKMKKVRVLKQPFATNSIFSCTTIVKLITS